MEQCSRNAKGAELQAVLLPVDPPTLAVPPTLPAATTLFLDAVIRYPVTRLQWKIPAQSDATVSPETQVGHSPMDCVHLPVLASSIPNCPSPLYHHMPATNSGKAPLLDQWPH